MCDSVSHIQYAAKVCPDGSGRRNDRRAFAMSFPCVLCIIKTARCSVAWGVAAALANIFQSRHGLFDVATRSSNTGSIARDPWTTWCQTFGPMVNSHSQPLVETMGSMGAINTVLQILKADYALTVDNGRCFHARQQSCFAALSGQIQLATNQCLRDVGSRSLTT